MLAMKIGMVGSVIAGVEGFPTKIRGDLIAITPAGSSIATIIVVTIAQAWSGACATLWTTMKFPRKSAMRSLHRQERDTEPLLLATESRRHREETLKNKVRMQK